MREPVIDKSAAKRIATVLGWQPKREWVGLTKEEIDRLNHVCVNGCNCSFCEIEGLAEFAEAIEVKLREKNGG